MSKKPAKPIRPQAATPKPQARAYDPTRFIDRPDTTTEKDPLYRKIFWGASLA
ncbi:MAG: hypothetical protein IT258_04310, partial [Saprospiraceae bacterium]|nr:hypothetical protein [Saprospiraceae bacterium]